MSKNGNIHPSLRVLLVEDSTEDEELIFRELRKSFKPVLKRVETEAALHLALDKETWDVVLCDYVLPAFSVHKALQIVKASGLNLPFIVISGSVDETVAIDTVLAGARDFIDKSKLARLTLAIRRELRQSGEQMQTRIDIESTLDETIKAWGKALELRDHFTGGHTQRVADMTLRLARRMGIPADQFVNIHRGALLHDIGKMGVPDAVLLKPGVLDRDEQVIMQMHPKLACEMLAPIGLMRDAIDIPCSHHEHWDGSGYPKRLVGEAIPLAARIFCVIDVYDALTSDRPYRKSWTKEKAIDYIKEQSGTLFDPAVVDRFVILIETGNGHER